MPETVRIRIKATGDITWARPGAAARLVEQGLAAYLDGQAPAPVEAAVLAPPENAAARTGRAPARKPRR